MWPTPISWIEAYLHALKTNMKAIIKHLYFCNTVTNNLGRSLLIKKNNLGRSSPAYHTTSRWLNKYMNPVSEQLYIIQQIILNT